jgi:glyoxylase-like metal-dependent hydrolase (beta-lactamase superfamily II)
MTRLTEGVYFIPGQDEFIPDSHVYVLGDPSSHDLSIVDAGLVGKGAYKIRSIEQMGIDLKDIKRIIMTHTHLDHLGCLEEIKQDIPWAETWIHSLEGEALEKGDERTVYGMDMFREMCRMQFGLDEGAFSAQVDRKLQGGEILDIGGMEWEVVHIPGHSMGSIGLYSGPKQVLISGDVVYADHSIGRFDLYGASAAALKNSLRGLAELDIKMLLPGHNRIVEALPSEYLEETVRQWEPQLV